MEVDLEKRATTRRRLLLAKQLYEHALDHSRTGSALDKMISVHNFHNAIEIVLRAIHLEHEIRVERELNIDFEVLINEIDKFPKFTEKGQRLPYRQELRKLNSTRNLVQHHAHEPEGSAMEEWRVFSRRFLAAAYREYFEEDFDGLTPVDLIADTRLRRLLLRSSDNQTRENWRESLRACTLAFQYASSSLREYLPRPGFQSPLFELHTGNQELDVRIERILGKVYERIAEAERYAAVLASGVNVANLARYQRTSISPTFTMSGSPTFEPQSKEIIADKVRWAWRFVVETIIRWQTTGLEPHVPRQYQNLCDRQLDEKPPSET